jgi:UDP-N-acetyl-D-mannosaminuronate dehydrogenase
MKKLLVIGLGKVGRALFDVARASGNFAVSALDTDPHLIDVAKPDYKAEEGCHVDVMLLCYPCTDRKTYVETALDYLDRNPAKLVIVNSSVAPGTTHSLCRLGKKRHRGILYAYSPVRGMPKNDMKKELKRWDKYVAGETLEAAQTAAEFFGEIGLHVVGPIANTKTLEMAKLFETTYRAVMIAASQEFHRFCIENNVEYAEAIELMRDDDVHRYDKPVMFPDVIGGTCLMPNIDLLVNASSFKSSLLQWVKHSNELRAAERQVPGIKQTIAKVKASCQIDELRRQRVYHQVTVAPAAEKKLWEPESE